MTSQPPQDEVEEVARAICGPNCDAPTCSCQPTELAKQICWQTELDRAHVAIATLDRLRSAAPAAGKDMGVAAGAAPIATVDIVTRLEELMKQGEEYIWRPAAEAATEIRQLRREAGELRERLTEMIGLVEDFHSFCRDSKRPCGEYGVECPISMGEWIDAEDLTKVARARASIAKATQ